MRNRCFWCYTPLSEDRIHGNWNCCQWCRDRSQKILQEMQEQDDEQIMREIAMCDAEYLRLESMEW